jgi:1,5-anhydro-D-fructose reductase (1,5-anhydro-D-mannitol-forming)
MMPAFKRSKNCEVRALARRDPAKAAESAKQYGIPHAFTSVEDLCRHPEVDAIFVTSPNSLHLSDVLMAVAAGKPVLCEKPMGMISSECRQMVEAARRANVLLGIAHVFRFEDSMAIFKEAIASGMIGPPVFARSEFSFQAGTSHPRKWLKDAQTAGAGPIFDIGVHCIDSLRFVLQDEVWRVTARTVADLPPSTVEASAVLVLEFEKGTLGTVLVSYAAEYRTPMEVVGGSGAIRAEDAFTVECPITIELRSPNGDVDQRTVSNELAYIRQVDAFADAVEGKSTFPCLGEHGWQNQEILDAALRSAKSGKPEDVPRVV